MQSFLGEHKTLVRERKSIKIIFYPPLSFFPITISLHYSILEIFQPN